MILTNFLRFFGFFRFERYNKTLEFRRLYSRLLAQDVIMNMPFTGMWVKNSKFELLEISEQAANLLYNKTSNDCIGLTDYHIAREGGLDLTEDQFSEVCRSSDLMLCNNKPKTYIEFLKDTEGKNHIWKTVKTKMCLNGECYYFGFAIFLDTLMGYEAAIERVERDIALVDRVNENLLVYK